MKNHAKRLTAALAAMLLLLCVAASALAATLKTAPIGSAEEIFSAVAVYCGKWNSLIGETMGYNMTFDAENVTQKESKHYNMGGIRVTTFDFDGISAEITDDLTVYGIQIPIRSGQEGQYASTARVFALVSAVAYDYPSSDAEMTDRYMSLLSEYLDFMEANKDVLAAGDIAYWEKETDKGSFEFSFMAGTGGQIRMIYEQIYFED